MAFLNHQLDIGLLNKIGAELARRFAGKEITKILTIEASGIAVACIAAQHFGDVPVVLQKKPNPEIWMQPTSSQVKSIPIPIRNM